MATVIIWVDWNVVYQIHCFQAIPIIQFSLFQKKPENVNWAILKNFITKENLDKPWKYKYSKYTKQLCSCNLFTCKQSQSYQETLISTKTTVDNKINDNINCILAGKKDSLPIRVSNFLMNERIQVV